MKKFIVNAIAGCLFFQLAAQDLPVKEQPGQPDKPLIFLVSGDGGLKGFTVSLCNAIHDNGYSITSMDARSYFWDKKTPEQTADAIAGYISAALRQKANRHWVMIGYSFGGDITPFVVNRLPDSLRSQLTNVILLSPSTSTDFEIHFSDMLGIGKKRSMDVIAEINRLTVSKTTLLFGEDENSFPLGQIKLPNYNSGIIKGGHHFDGDFRAVAARLCAEIR